MADNTMYLLTAREARKVGRKWSEGKGEEVRVHGQRHKCFPLTQGQLKIVKEFSGRRKGVLVKTKSHPHGIRAFPATVYSADQKREVTKKLRDLNDQYSKKLTDAQRQLSDELAGKHSGSELRVAKSIAVAELKEKMNNDLKAAKKNLRQELKRKFAEEKKEEADAKRAKLVPSSSDNPAPELTDEQAQQLLRLLQGNKREQKKLNALSDFSKFIVENLQSKIYPKHKKGGGEGYRWDPIQEDLEEEIYPRLKKRKSNASSNFKDFQWDPMREAI